VERQPWRLPGAVPQLWKVPVCLRYPEGSGEAREGILLDQPARQITLSKTTSCPAWIVANTGADGYYRVLYQACPPGLRMG
jgi:cytosol alanyl aminopeptidase